MISEDEAKRLHDRATRGMVLSATEQAALAAWYAQQDAAEQAALAGTPPSQTQDELRAEIGAVVSRLRIVTQQIEAQTAENERLRRENALLQRELLERRAAPQT
jgi:hypothetical protein